MTNGIYLLMLTDKRGTVFPSTIAAFLTRKEAENANIALLGNQAVRDLLAVMEMEYSVVAVAAQGGLHDLLTSDRK